MYLDHFGLERPPFKITPDPRLFFSGGKRGSVLDALVYAITTGEGIVKVVGEVGSGKTMLCRMLETRLPANVEIVYIANPSLSPANILQVVAFELNLQTREADRLQAMQTLQNWLLEQHADGRQVVVFIEEAQGMPLETLEEIRLLSNLEPGNRSEQVAADRHVRPAGTGCQARATRHPSAARADQPQFSVDPVERQRRSGVSELPHAFGRLQGSGYFRPRQRAPGATLFPRPGAAR
jgi:hypothetical protein